MIVVFGIYPSPKTVFQQLMNRHVVMSMKLHIVPSDSPVLDLISVSFLGSGCCSVGRAVTRDPRFKASRQQNFVINIFTGKKMKIKRKEAGIGSLLKNHSRLSNFDPIFLRLFSPLKHSVFFFYKGSLWQRFAYLMTSVTRFGNLLDFGQLLKAFNIGCGSSGDPLLLKISGVGYTAFGKWLVSKNYIIGN